MSSKIKLLLGVIFVLVSCKNKNEQVLKNEPLAIENHSQFTKHSIEVEALLSSLDKPNIKIIDFRKKDAFQKGHMPNALSVWRSDIESIDYPYKGMMASKETLEKLFSKLGIANNDTLIVYDNRGGCDASRLWRVLHHYGFESVQLLNGGLKSWVAAKGTITKDETLVEATIFEFPETSKMQLLINREKLSGVLQSENKPVLIDTRTEDEFTGKRKKLGAVKAGRIPGSIHIDWASSIDFHGSHKLRSIDELEKRYRNLTPSKDDLIVTYCHSGVRSAQTTFILTQLLGYTNVQNYDGSWSEWSYFNDLPFEKDSITTILQ